MFPKVFGSVSVLLGTFHCIPWLFALHPAAHRTDGAALLKNSFRSYAPFLTVDVVAKVEALLVNYVLPLRELRRSMTCVETQV